MATEVLMETQVISPDATGLDRRVLNNALLFGLCSRFGGYNLTALTATIEPSLLRLSGELDFSGLSKLSPLQAMVYRAITAPENYSRTERRIAWELGLRDANFSRLSRRVYDHLGVRGRGQAVVYRLAGEAGKQN
jgi:hypothetical protein